jgi:hypothetical protein
MEVDTNFIGYTFQKRVSCDFKDITLMRWLPWPVDLLNTHTYIPTCMYVRLSCVTQWDEISPFGKKIIPKLLIYYGLYFDNVCKDKIFLRAAYNCVIC